MQTTPGDEHQELLIPVTIGQWHEAFHCRNGVFGSPSGYWCYVPSGTYAIGGWNMNQSNARLWLRDFWIARYPVTVEQYRWFIESGGYWQQEWWTYHGWAWRERMGRMLPWFWDDDRVNRNDQPVVGVTWYEATAFARWLDSGLVEAGEAFRVRLPTEAQWEVACSFQAMQRYPYPWGSERPCAMRADFGKDWARDGPASVGSHPAGVAFCGAHAMIGGVWEATTSSHTPYPVESNVVIDDFAPIAYDVPWRGGGWGNNRVDIRCSARTRGYPDGVVYHDDSGFRLVLAPR